MSNKLWGVNENEFYPSYETIKSLPSDQFTIQSSMVKGIYLERHSSEFDDLMILPDSQSEKIVNYINDFWKMEDQFRAYGYMWKRGVLLYGPPGSGKTSTIQLVNTEVVNNGGIVLYCDNPSLMVGGLELIRAAEPKRPIVLILEDIDSIIEDYGESQLLALLDGEHQFDNIVFLATTNYPEELDSRIINRPSRFDIVEEIGMPNSDARKIYIENVTNKAGDKIENIEEWVRMTEGFSIAHIKEIIISVRVFGNTLEESVERMGRLMEENFGGERKLPLATCGEVKASEIDLPEDVAQALEGLNYSP